MEQSLRRDVKKSFLLSMLGFIAAFMAVYLAYCLVDSFINSGNQIWQGNSVFSHMILDPTEISLGLGAYFLRKGKLQPKAILLGFAVFLASFLVFDLWNWLLPPKTIEQFDPRVIPLVVPLHEVILGLVTGAVIGVMQAGWKKAGWYAAAGAFGMITGFLLMDVAGRMILHSSPYAADISSLVVGGFWYYLNLVLPAIIQGAFLGTFIGVAEMVVAPVM